MWLFSYGQDTLIFNHVIWGWHSLTTWLTIEPVQHGSQKSWNCPSWCKHRCYFKCFGCCWFWCCWTKMHGTQHCSFCRRLIMVLHVLTSSNFIGFVKYDGVLYLFVDLFLSTFILWRSSLVLNTPVLIVHLIQDFLGIWLW